LSHNFELHNNLKLYLMITDLDPCTYWRL